MDHDGTVFANPLVDDVIRVDTVIEMEPTVKKHGSVMSFHNITYTVEVKPACCGSCRPGEKRTILNDVSGILRPGLNAIMGSTGSGKSSLLDVLANRKDRDWLSGAVLLDGKSLPKNFHYHSGYVVQNDLFLATVTVREALWFCANLRLPRSLSYKEKKEKIDRILEDLGLQSCADTKIGNELIRGISGGEKKRTSIASELILEPQILFLDEPTTGLDAATAWYVMLLLKRLGDQGHTIVCSIHQPRYSIYKLFDTLTLLSRGELVFHGAVVGVLPFFESLGYACETHDNPADFILDVLNGGHENPNTRSSGKKSIESEVMKTIKDKYKTSQECQSLEEELRKIEEAAGNTKTKSGRMYATGFSRQMRVLLSRTAKNMVRNPQALLGNAVVNTVIGVVFGLIYFQVDNSPDKGIQNRLGVLFFICTNLLFGATLVIDNFIKEREIFIQEHVSGYYSVFSYFLSKVIADLVPMRTLSPIIFCSITYWMVGFKTEPGAFFTFLLTAVMVGYSAVGIGLFYSSTFSQSVGHLFVVLTFVFTIIFSGLLINVDSVMPWLSWLKYLSVARYGLVALSINELRDRTFSTCRNATSFDQPPASSFGSATSEFTTTITNGTRCIYIKGEEYLHTSLAISDSPDNISDWDLWQNHVALTCIIIGLYTLTYIQLARIKKYS